MTTIFPETLTCPMCENEFEGLVLGSTNTMGPLTTDFRRFAAGYDPLSYSVQTCPSCGYTDETSGFGMERNRGRANIPPVSSDIVARVRQEITPIVAGEVIDAGRKYEFLARMSEWQDANPLQTGWHYLAAAWCCDDLADDEPDRHGDGGERARDYRRRARALFERGVQQSTASPEEQPTYSYLVGELSRRLGDPESATWFQQVIDDASATPFWRALAYQQRTSPRDFVEHEELDLARWQTEPRSS